MLSTSLVDRCCSWTLFWFLLCCCEKCMNTGSLQREVYLGLWLQRRVYKGEKDMAAGSHSRKLREHTSSSTCKKWRRNQKWGNTIKSQSLLPGITSSSKAMPHNHKGSIASPKQHHQGSNTWAMRNIFYSDHHKIFMESNYSPQK